MNEQPIKYQNEIISNLDEMQIDYDKEFTTRLCIVSFRVHHDTRLSFLFERSKTTDGNKLINVRLAYDTVSLDNATGIHIKADSLTMRPTYIFVMTDGEDVAMIDLIEA